MDDAIAVCFPIIAIVDEKVMDRAKSFEGDSVAKWHGGVEVDGMMKKNMREMYAEGGQDGVVCGLFV